MDPDDTFKLLLVAYKETNWQDAIEYAEAMLSWLQVGGFPPQVTSGVRVQDLLFEFGDELLNSVAANAIARKILLCAKHEQALLAD